jgi:hypothetical protein
MPVIVQAEQPVLNVPVEHSDVYDATRVGIRLALDTHVQNIIVTVTVRVITFPIQFCVLLAR